MPITNLKNTTDEHHNKETDVNFKATSGKPEPSAIETEDMQIRLLAYSVWEQRRSPHGSPEDDWFNAKEKLRYEERSKVVAVGKS